MIISSYYREGKTRELRGIPLDILRCDDTAIVVHGELDGVEVPLVADIAEELLVVLIDGQGGQPAGAVHAPQARLVERLPVRADHLKQKIQRISQALFQNSGTDCHELHFSPEIPLAEGHGIV